MPRRLVETRVVGGNAAADPLELTPTTVPRNFQDRGTDLNLGTEKGLAVCPKCFTFFIFHDYFTNYVLVRHFSTPIPILTLRH